MTDMLNCFSKSLLMFLFLLGQIMQILALFEGHTVTPGKFIWKYNYEMFILLWDERYIPPFLIIICLILSLPFPLMAKYDYEAFHHLLWNLEGNSIMHSWYLSSNGMYSLPFSCDNLSLPATS